MAANGKYAKYNLLQVIVRIIPIQVSAAPWNCLLENCLGVMHGLSFAMTVVATQRLFDTASHAAAGRAGYGECVISLAALAVVIFGQQIINGVQNFHGIGILLPKSAGGLCRRRHLSVPIKVPVDFNITFGFYSCHAGSGC